jgi:hypothetical protein
VSKPGRVNDVVIVAPSMRVVEPDNEYVHIRGFDSYATLCGLTDDAYLGTGKAITYGTRRKVTCWACIGTAKHAAQFVS